MHKMKAGSDGPEHVQQNAFDTKPVGVSKQFMVIALIGFPLLVLLSLHDLISIKKIRTIALDGEHLPSGRWDCLDKGSFLSPSRALVPGEVPPCVFLGDPHTIVNVEYSIVLIVFNQEEFVPRVLDRIFENTVDTWELIIVFDYCLDDSIHAVIKSLQGLGCTIVRYKGKDTVQCGKPQNVLLLNHPTPAFEATATNTALKVSQGTYSILVQDDTMPMSRGWNKLMSLPTKCFDDVVGVTARKAHSFVGMQEVVGTDGNTEEPVDYVFHVRDTCNRGPLLLRMDYVRRLNYLDDTNFFLEFDDHDFFARAWHFENLVCGQLSGIHIQHSYEHSGTRTNKKAKFTALSEWTKLYRSKSKGNGFIHTLDQSGDSSHNDERNVSEICPDITTDWPY